MPCGASVRFLCPLPRFNTFFNCQILLSHSINSNTRLLIQRDLKWVKGTGTQGGKCLWTEGRRGNGAAGQNGCAIEETTRDRVRTITTAGDKVLWRTFSFACCNRIACYCEPNWYHPHWSFVPSLVPCFRAEFPDLWKNARHSLTRVCASSHP